MLASINRIHGRGVFKKLLREGKMIRGEQISLNYSKSRSNRLKSAVVVSKKTSKSAVKRNRIRRRVYEIVRKEYLPKNLGYNLIFLVFSEDIVNIPHEELVRRIDSLIKKANIL